MKFSWTFVAHENQERLPSKDEKGQGDNIDKCFRGIQQSLDVNLLFKETFIDGDALVGVHEVHLPHRFNSQAWAAWQGGNTLGTLIISPLQ